MAWLALVLPFVILALLAVAIYEHVTTITLSLPLAPALTFLTIFLPLLAAANLFALPQLTRKTKRGLSRSPNNDSHSNTAAALLRLVSPAALQVLQALATTVLATLYATHLAPSESRECELATRWQRLFRAKDARAVRAVQDALQCCGFRSVRDMAWPFPPADVPCAARFDRTLACRGPWAEALRRGVGVELGVVLAVGVLQILSVILARRYAGRFGVFSWGEIFRQSSRQDGFGGSVSSRPLLTGRETQTEEVEEEEEEEEGNGVAGRETGRAYGSIENGQGSGPRIEPSGLQQPHNAWRED